MKTRKILSAFGLNLWRSNGMWHACRPTEGPAFAEFSSKNLRDLIEWVVPPPPAILSPGSIRAWAEDCIAECYGDVVPEDLAKAAFAAYDLAPSSANLESFIAACRVDRRKLMESRG